MRQDPDVLLVGETRDLETAKTAIEAALTGHLVLSTLHANDAPSTIARLDEMGVEPFMVSAALIGIVSQRLMRRVCSLAGERIDRMNESWVGSASMASCRKRCDLLQSPSPFRALANLARTCKGSGLQGPSRRSTRCCG
jgi:type IV pilus assembly protein PilB